MGLELPVRNKFDGNTVSAFHVIDLINVNLPGDTVQIYGRVFVSQAAFQSSLEPIDTFSYTIPKFKTVIKTLPSTVETDAYAWLKSLPQFTGAIDKGPVAVSATAVAVEK